MSEGKQKARYRIEYITYPEYLDRFFSDKLGHIDFQRKHGVKACQDKVQFITKL